MAISESPSTLVNTQLKPFKRLHSRYYVGWSSFKSCCTDRLVTGAPYHELNSWLHARCVVQPQQGLGQQGLVNPRNYDAIATGEKWLKGSHLRNVKNPGQKILCSHLTVDMQGLYSRLSTRFGHRNTTKTQSKPRHINPTREKPAIPHLSTTNA